MMAALAAGLVGACFAPGTAGAGNPQPEPPTSCEATGSAVFKRALQPAPLPVKFKDRPSTATVNLVLDDCVPSALCTSAAACATRGVLKAKLKAPTSIATGFLGRACATVKVTWYNAAGKRLGVDKPTSFGAPGCTTKQVPLGLFGLPGTRVLLSGGGTSSRFVNQPFIMQWWTNLSDPGFASGLPITSFQIGATDAGSARVLLSCPTKVPTVVAGGNAVDAADSPWWLLVTPRRGGFLPQCHPTGTITVEPQDGCPLWVDGTFSLADSHQNFTGFAPGTGRRYSTNLWGVPAGPTIEELIFMAPECTSPHLVYSGDSHYLPYDSDDD
jgi:hypothetical protein